MWDVGQTAGMADYTEYKEKQSKCGKSQTKTKEK